MTTGIAHHCRRLAAVLSTVALVTSGALGFSTSSGATTTHSGTVKVLSAGSLSNLMVLLGAAFKHDTGYALQNTSLGSSAIASGIDSKTLQGDVFISASSSADLSLEGSAHGNWISGYTTIGSSPDVLAYYPKSRFVSALKTRPWYDVIQSPGFEIGRTDPAVDPAGVLDVDALYGIGYAYNIALVDLDRQQQEECLYRRGDSGTAASRSAGRRLHVRPLRPRRETALRRPVGHAEPRRRATPSPN